MVQPWNAYIHVGIVHPMVFPETLKGEGPVLETVTKIVNDVFFGAIEVSWIKDPKVRLEVARLLEQAHVDVVYCGGPPILMQGLSLNAPDSATRKKALNGAKKLVDEAYELSARVLVVCSGPNPARDRRGEAKGLLAESLKDVCRYAEREARDYTLLISLENFDMEQDKKLLIGPTAEAAEVARAVKGECGNFGLTVDLSHIPLLKETPEEAISTAGNYLEHAHMGNCVVKDKSSALYGDAHPRLGVKGGENDVEELTAFLRALRDNGYFSRKTATSLPVVSFEVKPAAGEASEAVIAGSKRAFLDAWARI